MIVLLVISPLPREALVDDFETDFWLPFTHFHLGDQASAGYSALQARSGFRSYHVEIHGWKVRDFGSAYGYAFFATHGASVAELRLSLLFDALADSSPSIWDAYTAGIGLELLDSGYRGLGTFRYVAAYHASDNAGRCGPTVSDIVLDADPTLGVWQDIARNPAADFPSAPWSQGAYVKVSVGFLCAAGLTGASYSLYADDFVLETNSGDRDGDGLRDLEEETRLYTVTLMDAGAPRLLAPGGALSIDLTGSAVRGSFVAGAVAVDLAHPRPDDLSISLVTRKGAVEESHLLWDPGLRERGLAIVEPAPGRRLQGIVPVSGRAAPRVGLSGIHLLVDGEDRGLVPRDEAGWFAFNWDTAQEAEGVRVLQVAPDTYGGWDSNFVSDAMRVVVDRTPPTLEIRSPVPGAAVSGLLKVDAAPYDEQGVASVELRLDGTRVETRESEPFVFLYETLDLSNAPHSLEVVATDAAGNSITRAVPISVSNKANAPPPPCYPACNLVGGTTTGNLAPVQVVPRSLQIELPRQTRLDVSEGLSVPFHPEITHTPDGVSLVFDVLANGRSGLPRGLVPPTLSSADFMQSGTWRLVVRDFGAGLGGVVERASVRFAVRTLSDVADTDGDGLGDRAERAASLVPVLADLDADGLSDGYESTSHLVALAIEGEVQQRLITTSPSDPDSDDDGVVDGEELFPSDGANPSDPTVADTDADGLPDGLERYTYGTDPARRDTDGDTLDDGYEVLPKQLDLVVDGRADVRSVVTSPLLADTDADGLSDADEMIGTWSAGLRTDPTDPDTDRDGLTDGDELAGINRRPTSPTSSDTDADGLSDGVDLSPTEFWSLPWQIPYAPGLVRFTQRYHGFGVHGQAAEIYSWLPTDGKCHYLSDETAESTRDSDDRPEHAVATVNELFADAGQLNLTAVAARETGVDGLGVSDYWYGACTVTAPLRYLIQYWSDDHNYDIDFVNTRPFVVRDETGEPFYHAILGIPLRTSRTQSLLLQFTIPADGDRTTEDRSTTPAVFYSLFGVDDPADRAPFFQNFAVGTLVDDHAYQFTLRIPKRVAQPQNVLPGPSGPMVYVDLTPMWLTTSAAGVRKTALNATALTVGAFLTRVQSGAEMLVARLGTDMVALLDALPASGEGVSTGVHSYGGVDVYAYHAGETLDSQVFVDDDAVWLIGDGEEDLAGFEDLIPTTPSDVWVRSGVDAFGTTLGVMKVLRRGVSVTSQITAGMMAPLAAMPPGTMELMEFGQTSITVSKLSDFLSGDAYYVIGSQATVWGKSHYPHPEVPGITLTDTQPLEQTVDSEIVENLDDSRLLTGVKYGQLKLGLQAAAVGATVAVFGTQAVLAFRDGDMIRGTVYAVAGAIGVLGVVKGNLVLVNNAFSGVPLKIEVRLRVGVVAAIAVGGILAAYEVFQAGHAVNPIEKLSHYEAGGATVVDTLVGVLPLYGPAAMLGWQLGIGIAVGAQILTGVVPNALAARIAGSPGSLLTFLFEYVFLIGIPSDIAKAALVSVLTTLGNSAIFNNNMDPPNPTILLAP